jgi:hypothetical protein
MHSRVSFTSLPLDLKHSCFQHVSHACASVPDFFQKHAFAVAPETANSAELFSKPTQRRALKLQLALINPFTMCKCSSSPPLRTTSPLNVSVTKSKFMFPSEQRASPAARHSPPFSPQQVRKRPLLSLAAVDDMLHTFFAVASKRAPPSGASSPSNSTSSSGDDSVSTSTERPHTPLNMSCMTQSLSSLSNMPSHRQMQHSCSVLNTALTAPAHASGCDNFALMLLAMEADKQVLGKQQLPSPTAAADEARQSHDTAAQQQQQQATAAEQDAVQQQLEGEARCNKVEIITPRSARRMLC